LTFKTKKLKMKKSSISLDELLNSITHGIGALLSITALVLLVVFASIKPYGDVWKIVSFSIYGFSLILMYIASTLYHSFTSQKIKAVLNLFDHSAIYILIAGTYTPFTLVSLRGPWGWSIFGVIWGLAIAGVIFKIFFYSDRWRNISAVLYFLMGWIILIAIHPMIIQVPLGGLLWLLGGCLIYSVGIPFYIRRQNRYNHVIWHLFVLGGSITHFFAMLLYVLPA
jgi:hemolysin III